MPTLQEVTRLTLDVEFGRNHSPACVVKMFDAAEWCRVRPANRRQHLRACVDQIFEEMIRFIEPITEQETQNELTAARQAAEQAAFGSPLTLHNHPIEYVPNFSAPEVRSIGVDRPRRR